MGGTAPSWDRMTPMHGGVLTASPWETNEPRRGRWNFTIRAIDTSGNLSPATHIIAELPDPRLGDAILWDCPSAQGWPGTATNAIRSNDGLDALESGRTHTWDDMTTWDAWTSWALGDGDDGAHGMTYTTDAVDLGAEVPFSIAWEGETSGEVTFHSTAPPIPPGASPPRLGPITRPET